MRARTHKCVRARTATPAGMPLLVRATDGVARPLLGSRPEKKVVALPAPETLVADRARAQGGCPAY